MRRLPFELPEFTRVTWVDDRARAVWEPRLRRVSAAWREVQWLSVAAGIRPCAVLRVPQDEMPRHFLRWEALGVGAAVLAREGAGAPGYAARTPARAGDGPATLRVGFGGADDLRRLSAAWTAGDHDAIGTLLGYPPCCRAFFDAVWARRRLLDPTWAMAGGSDGENARPLRVSGPVFTNVLWRWVDVRAVPHLPCAFDCEDTAALGERLLELAERVGFAEEAGWCRAILSWPVEWSSLHGIAEIRAPVLKIATTTDAFTGKRVVQRAGTEYPGEGASGLHFPYRVRPVPAGRAAAFARGLANPIPRPDPRPAWYHADNGFSGRAAMDRAHRRLLRAARAALAVPEPHVADLGCGNGALLRLLREEAAPALVPYGVDLSPERIAHARDLWPGHSGNFTVGDVFDDETPWRPGRSYRLVLLGLNRLRETTPGRARRLLDRIREHADRLLVYSHDRAPDGAEPVASLVDLRDPAAQGDGLAGQVIAMAKAAASGLPG